MSILKKVLVVFLAINALMQIGMGIMMLVNFEEVVTSMFNLSYHQDMAAIGLVLGMNVLFLGIMIALSIFWIFKGENKGVSLGMLFGWIAITAGIVSFSQGTSEGLIIDVPRGIIILVLGYLIHRQDNSSSSLNKAPKV